MAPRVVPSPLVGEGGERRRREPGEGGMSLASAKRLRAHMTDAERRLRYHLRGHRFLGFKFKRQVPLGSYVVDFICFEHKLVVELDGGQHAESTRDQRRDSWLRQEGFQVLRFWNNDVLRNTEIVLTEIARTLERIANAPSPGALRAPPSPTRGEGKKPAAIQRSTAPSKPVALPKV
jgi:very-short-patch-repair endonuclease